MTHFSDDDDDFEDDDDLLFDDDDFDDDDDDLEDDEDDLEDDEDDLEDDEDDLEDDDDDDLEDDDEDLEGDDDELGEEEEEVAVAPQAFEELEEEPAPPIEEFTPAIAATPLGIDGGVAPKDIPMTISVEAGRLEMSAEKLIALRPGNMLEIPTLPEMGVALVVNGKQVGKGELIRVGETLGVRIVAMG
ncbi:MAG: flagellar motor switch protein FliN/FliY [Chlamydiales bacterium]|jgi:flagellar motor switch protein FliN/FliY